MNAFTSAVSWLEATLLGSFALAIAAIAVASVGFLMLTGRIDVRRAVQVILGCFIIFGASTIASGLLIAVSASGEGPPAAQSLPPPTQLSAPAVGQQSNATPYDPYAGAAIQQQ